MNCPHCGAPVQPSSKFCPRCRTPLQPQQAYPPTIPAGAPPPQPAQPPPQQPYPPPQPFPGSPQPVPPPVGQLGPSGQAAIGIWGPFAGYGKRGRHTAWLLDNLGDRADQLRNVVTQRFQQRQIPDARVDLQTLRSKGVAVEQRLFYRIKRGITTAWLYIARFGQDLYISQVTYVLGPISKARVLLFLLMLSFEVFVILSYLFNFIALPAAIQAMTPSTASIFGGPRASNPLADLAPWTTMLTCCCTGPLGTLNSLALLLGLFFSAYKFATERDPLAILRTPPNEFQQDDIVALERSVEDTVRQSLDLIGIDSKLMSPAAAYRSERRLF